MNFRDTGASLKWIQDTFMEDEVVPCDIVPFLEKCHWPVDIRLLSRTHVPRDTDLKGKELVAPLYYNSDSMIVSRQALMRAFTKVSTILFMPCAHHTHLKLFWIFTEWNEVSSRAEGSTRSTRCTAMRWIHLSKPLETWFIPFYFMMMDIKLADYVWGRLLGPKRRINKVRS